MDFPQQHPVAFSSSRAPQGLTPSPHLAPSSCDPSWVDLPQQPPFVFSSSRAPQGLTPSPPHLAPSSCDPSWVDPSQQPLLSSFYAWAPQGLTRSPPYLDHSYCDPSWVDPSQQPPFSSFYAWAPQGLHHPAYLAPSSWDPTPPAGNLHPTAFSLHMPGGLHPWNPTSSVSSFSWASFLVWSFHLPPSRAPWWPKRLPLSLLAWHLGFPLMIQHSSRISHQPHWQELLQHVHAAGCWPDHHHGLHHPCGLLGQSMKLETPLHKDWWLSLSHPAFLFLRLWKQLSLQAFPFQPIYLCQLLCLFSHSPKVQLPTCQNPVLPTPGKHVAPGQTCHPTHDQPKWLTCWSPEFWNVVFSKCPVGL